MPGLSFSHNDWQIVCDNTRTCRAAGYSEDGAERRVSVLLTRAAGPGEAVKGQLMLGSYGEEDEAFYAALPKNIKLTLHINERPAGRVTVPQDSLVADLPPQQVAALLAALRGNTTIEWSSGDNRWPLSGAGAAAVLLKMDEFQGRLGTRGAIIRKGPKGEDDVLPPLPPQQVVAAPLPKTLPEDAKLAKNKSLRKALRTAIGKDDDCPDFDDETLAAEGLTIARLNSTQLLASARCWMGAYNAGYGYWVINAQPPFHPVLVTYSGSDLNGSEISSMQKGRGLGDCWSSDSWTWDGNQFVQTEASSTGMCRLIAPGGAWSLPQIVTKGR
ncbi:MAG: DUF1176 domain-containing protein [Azonexaceae bacterium]|nr:DUF1176 domain-containing protein [Azonexaceae bacterium]